MVSVRVAPSLRAFLRAERPHPLAEAAAHLAFLRPEHGERQSGQAVLFGPAGAGRGQGKVFQRVVLAPVEAVLRPRERLAGEGQPAVRKVGHHFADRCLS